MRLFRDQAAILIVLFDNPNFVSGLSLADYNRIKVKFLKKEIDYLNGICRSNGCEIISKSGIGYRLDIIDKSHFETFKNEIEKKYYGFYLYRNAQSERVHYIVRQLLVGQDLNVQDFADRSNYSQSTIRRDIPKIKRKLGQYNLEFRNKANKGMYVVGDEWNLRLALVHENYVYNKFDNVYFFGREKIDDIFMNGQGFRESIYQKLKKVLRENEYYVSYESLTNIGDMILVSLKRRKYSKNLIDNPKFQSIDLNEEKQLILSLFNSIEGESGQALLENDLNYLAVFIKGKKVFRFQEIEKLNRRDEIYNISSGFLKYFNQHFDIGQYDTSVLYKDLCCEIAAMMLRNDFDIHISSIATHQFKQDGAINLDICTLLYFYLKENTNIDCDDNDVAMFYYCISYFAKERSSKHIAKILVVSKHGYFISRSFAYNYQRLLWRKDVEFIPVEYLRLKDSDLTDIAGIITDIEDLDQEYENIVIVDSHFLRRNKDVKKAVNNIVYSKMLNSDSLITKEQIHYVHSFKDMKEIEDYIRKNILTKEDDKDKFFEEFYKKDLAYSSRRNNILLVNTIGDYLGRSFISFIALEEFMDYKDDCINKIVIYNVAGKSLYKWGLISERIVKLFHSYEFIFTGNIEEDYVMIQNIMFDR